MGKFINFSAYLIENIKKSKENLEFFSLLHEDNKVCYHQQLDSTHCHNDISSPIVEQNYDARAHMYNNRRLDFI